MTSKVPSPFCVIVADVVTSLSATLPTGVPAQYSSYAPVRGVPGVVVGGVDDVVDVVGVVVVVVSPLEYAITGLMEVPEGVPLEIPVGFESFG